VPGAEVAVRQAVSQHGSDRGEHRLLVAASDLGAEESCLGLGLGAHTSPRSGDQRGLEPRCAVVHVGGAALPGTLVVFRVKGAAHDARRTATRAARSALADYRWSVNTRGSAMWPPQRLEGVCIWRAAPERGQRVARSLSRAVAPAVPRRCRTIESSHRKGRAWLNQNDLKS
jgi:hypothetical protein